MSLRRDYGSDEGRWSPVAVRGSGGDNGCFQEKLGSPEDIVRTELVQLSEDSGGEVETGYKVGVKDVQWVGKQRGARLGWKRCSV
jgi:hypothetical protein